MLDLLKAVQTLAGVLTPERITQRRRRKVAHALLELHLSLGNVVKRAQDILRASRFQDGAAVVPPELLEAQSAALAEVQRILESSPVSTVLRVKLNVLSEVRGHVDSKGNDIMIALAAYYGLMDQADAEREVSAQQKRIGGIEGEAFEFFETAADQEWALPELLHLAREQEADVALFATPRHLAKARSTVRRLSEANERLRKYLAKEFTVEELL